MVDWGMMNLVPELLYNSLQSWYQVYNTGRRMMLLLVLPGAHTAHTTHTPRRLINPKLVVGLVTVSGSQRPSCLLFALLFYFMC